jgi:hypothetical protein
LVTIEDVRGFAAGLPRTQEALVQDRVKFRVGRIVSLFFSRDETLMGFAFPKVVCRAASTPRSEMGCDEPSRKKKSNTSPVPVTSR